MACSSERSHRSLLLADGHQGADRDDHCDAEASDSGSEFVPPSGRRRSQLLLVGIGVFFVVAMAYLAALRVTSTSATDSLSESGSSTKLSRFSSEDRPMQSFLKSASNQPSASAAITVGRRATMYCFMVMLPFGNERVLVKEQYDNGWGIFGCDAYAVYSNETLELSPGHLDGENTTTFPGSMVVKFNTWTWKKFDVKLALNTDVFVRVWRTVFELGHWRKFDWTVKLDPDTVFFPDRLSDLLTARPLLPHPNATVSASAATCGNCTLPERSNETCASHVRWLQHDGLTCGESLNFVARDPPHDCGCSCPVETCHRPASVYLRNCAINLYTPHDFAPLHALHGPMEALSLQAMEDYELGLDACVKRFQDSYDQWGEDWFLEHCLLYLGVNPLDNFASLKDGDCSTNAWPCDSPHAAFQPFKTLDGYRKCHKNAETIGRWPPQDPQYAEHKRWSHKLNEWITYDENDKH